MTYKIITCLFSTVLLTTSALGQEGGWDASRASDREKCFGSEPLYCTFLGIDLREGLDKGPIDYPEARTVFTHGCRHGEGGCCVLLGHMWESGQGGEKDSSKAMESFKKACELKDSGGCSSVAKRYFTGHGSAPDFDQARRYFALGCGGEFQQLSCIYLGVMMHAGVGGPADVDGAMVRMRQGCDRNWAKRCGKEGAKVFAGLAGIPSEPAASAALFEVACERGDFWSCGVLGNLLYRGEVIPEDRTRGRELAGRACEEGEADPGCGVYGAALYHGHGGAQNHPLARKVLKQACDAGHGPSCRILGIMWLKGLGGKANEVRAIVMQQRACEARDRDGCYIAAQMWEGGQAGKKSRHKALEYYDAGCTFGHPQSCQRAGNLWYTSPDVSPKARLQARRLFSSGCLLGDQQCCLDAARTYREEGTEMGLSTAFKLYSVRCRKSAAEACMWVGVALRDGKGVEKDEPKGEGILEALCKDGYQPACGR